MYVNRAKELIAENDGTVTDVGYETFGNYKKAFIEVYYEDVPTVPSIPELETHDDVIVDTQWDAENNGVMYEVTISERDM